MGIDAFRIEIDIISVIVYLMIWYSNREHAVQDKAASAFQHLVEFSIAFSVLNSTGLFISESNIALTRLTNSFKVISCICMGCTWFLSIFYTSSANVYTLRKWLFPIVGPSVIVSGITLADSLMHLTEGPVEMSPIVWILLNILSIIYIAAASALSLINARKCKNRFKRSNFYMLSVLMLFPLFSLIPQSVYYNIPITSSVFLLITLFVYLYRVHQRITIDSATGLNNVNKMSSYLESITQSQDPAKRLFFIKIEIDNFKTMQKKYGKVAGLMALQKMANFLREQSVFRGTFIAHYGKSTFAIIAECNDFSEVEAFTNKIISASSSDQELSQGPWPITFSIHWSEYGTSDTHTIDELLDKAEENCIKPASA